jgi:hypothetical protein
MGDDAVIALTVKWLERAVIGLNLCPFAKGVHVKGQIHYAVTAANTRADLLEVLKNELNGLQAQESTVRDTTLLIAPDAFPDFWDFNDFLPECDRLLRRMKLDGVFQIASFHPHFQFADTEPDDITNYTNRAPFPILHLLREDSIDRAVEAFPEPDTIFEKNKQTLQDLGVQGWSALDVQAPNTTGDTPPHVKIAAS